MSNQIQSFVRIPAGVTVRMPGRNEGEPSIPVEGDGQVDSALLDQLGEQALSGLDDSRLLQTLATRNKREGAELGADWTGSYRDLPVYSNRGIIGLQQDSTFKHSDADSGNGQTLSVDWAKREVKLESNLVGAGQAHEVTAAFDYDGKIKADTVAEAFYLFAR